MRRPIDATTPAGALCPAWGERFGLPAGIPIAVGAFDVHYGSIGCGVREGTLVKAIGTSTCDCCVVSPDHLVADIPGICGIVKGSILPGFIGLEAGQSAVGDLFKWWVEVICAGGDETHAELTREAAKLAPGQTGLVALDWNNGNRTILVDQLLTGLLVGQTLYTTRAEVYRALIEAHRLRRAGHHRAPARIRRQNRPRRLLRRDRGEESAADANLRRRDRLRDGGGQFEPGLRAGFGDRRGGAGAARIRTSSTAQAAMTSVRAERYDTYVGGEPKSYDELYSLYRDLHDSFGGLKQAMDLSHVMKRLIEIKYAALHEAS